MLVSTASSPLQETSSPAPLAATIDLFLADIGPRAFRFAEAGLRHREDALDAVQDAMMKMLAYREKPAEEWSPLFWSILRRRIVDLQRRTGFRLRWLLPTGDRGEEGPVDWAPDHGAGPAQAHDQREAYARLVQALRALPNRQREAFTLRVLEELDVADTARAGQVSLHRSLRATHSARDALQKQLEEFR